MPQDYGRVYGGGEEGDRQQEEGRMSKRKPMLNRVSMLNIN